MRLPVPFGVSPDALAADASDVAGQVSSHRDLLKLWTRFGVLVQPEEDDALARRIDALPVCVRKLWQEVLTTSRRRRNPESAALAEPLGPRDAERLRGVIDLGLVTAASAVRYGAQGERPSARFSTANLELCRFDLARHSEHFQWAERMSEEGVPKGANLDAVWAERIAGFLSFAPHLLVVDRYCVADHIQNRDSPSGLTRLLRAVASTPTIKSCQIFAAYAPQYPRDTLKNAVKSTWRTASGGRSGTSVELWTCDERTFGLQVHHRWVRFDRVQVRLDKGLNDFSGRLAKRFSPMTIAVVDQQTRNLEDDLRRVCVRISI